MAITLTEAAKLSTTDLQKGVLDVLLQCLFSRLISIFPQCGRMVFPGLVIMQSVM